MISFTKSFFYKQANPNKISSIDTDELGYSEMSYNKADGISYAEKVAAKGLTFRQMHLMYLSNVWVRAIVDKIVERVTDVAPIVKPIRQRIDQDVNDTKLPDDVKKNMDTIYELLVKPNSNNESLTSIRKKVSRDLLKYDAGAMEIVNGANLVNNKKLIELYAVPGNTIKLNVDKRGMLDADDKGAYVQLDRNMRIVAKWNKDKMMYLTLNPNSDRVYGLSPLESLIQTVTAELYSSQYNLDFFYNNATPRFAVLMEGLGIGQGAAALQRFRTWWDTELQGNPHRPIIIGTENGKIQFQQVGLSNEEMQFQEYSKQLLVKIMVVYKMQPLVLGVDVGVAGKATSSKSNESEQVRQFKIDAVKPHMSAFTDKFNAQVIFSKTALNIQNAYMDFDLDIVDKKTQAEWHELYLKNGVITINEIRIALGMMPVPWGNVPYLQNNLVPFGAGKNGQAVPGDPSQVKLDQAGADVPDINITNKSALKKYISQNGDQPIGWENMEVNERLEIVEQLIKAREQFLSKAYLIPNSKIIKQEQDAE